MHAFHDSGQVAAVTTESPKTSFFSMYITFGAGDTSGPGGGDALD